MFIVDFETASSSSFLILYFPILPTSTSGSASSWLSCRLILILGLVNSSFSYFPDFSVTFISNCLVSSYVDGHCRLYLKSPVVSIVRLHSSLALSKLAVFCINVVILLLVSFSFCVIFFRLYFFWFSHWFLNSSNLDLATSRLAASSAMHAFMKSESMVFILFFFPPVPRLFVFLVLGPTAGPSSLWSVWRVLFRMPLYPLLYFIDLFWCCGDLFMIEELRISEINSLATCSFCGFKSPSK